MRRKVLVFVAVFFIATGGGELFHGKLQSSSELSIPIKIQELAGLRIKNMPLFCGIPFPQGRLIDEDGLGIVDSRGQSVPAQLQVMARWPRDGSIRWLGVDFLGGVEPKKTAGYRLAYVNAKPLPDIGVSSVDGRWVIDTGTLRFQIDSKSFNGLDGVWLDPQGRGRYSKKTVVSPEHDGGLSLQVNNRIYRSFNAPVDVVVEETGPVKAILRLNGRFVQEEDDSSFEFMLRITAFRGQRFLKMDYTLTNLSTEPWVHVQSADVFLPIDDEGKRPSVVYGKEKSLFREPLSNEPIWGSQRAENRMERSGPATRWETDAPGWCDRQSRGYGVGLAMRWFSEMHPKRWVAEKAGLRMEIVPADGESVAWASGVARTHSMIWAFHPASDSSTIQQIVGMAQREPVVTADPQWICSSGVFGTMVSSSASQRDEALKSLGQSYDHRFAEDLKGILATGLAGRLTVDQGATGLFDFGDLPFVRKLDDKPIQRKEDIYWSNHQYDLPGVLWLQYARTSEPALAELAEIFALHMGEVDTHHPSGAARIAPARLHVRDFRTRQVGLAEDLSFAKNKGLLWCYYFTGNRRARELALLSADYALSVESINLQDPKTLGAGITTLLSGYELTGDPKYLDHADGLINQALDWQREHGGGLPADYTFQMGLALASYVEFLQWKESPEVIEGIYQGVNYAIFHFWSPRNARIQDDGGLTLSAPLGFAFHTTGNIKYRDIALSQLVSWINAPTTIRNARDFAVYYHNIPNLLGWLYHQKSHE